MRHDVAPQVRRRGVAVQEHDGVARPGLHIRHALAEHGGVALRIAFETRHVHVRPQARQEHRVRARRVLQADGDDLPIGARLPPRPRRRQGGEADDDVVVARFRAVRPLARPGGQHPAFVGLDGAHHAALVFAEGVAVAHVEVGDEVGGHGVAPVGGEVGWCYKCIGASRAAGRTWSVRVAEAGGVLAGHARERGSPATRRSTDCATIARL